ncbi:MAG: aspartate carbamoyltransferase [Candidatus Caldarchaeum sp.]|uniref:Aspartate carbamoyltransferase n=1 Tax=Caldiarchaeum subterraneum TaxID=311458 RepID=A0A7C5Q7V3_CALS0
MTRHILSAKQFERQEVLKLFEDSRKLNQLFKQHRVIDIAGDRILMTVFLEPSTRTRLSFTFAMKRFGGMVIDFGPEEVTSRAKGESFEDTMRMLDGYAPDVIVLRSKEVGAAEKASKIVRCSVINAGDGWNEHPTQALLDVYTIWEIFGSVDGLRIGIMGDLRYGRTPSSLSYLLSKFNDVKIHFIAPPELQIRQEILEAVKNLETHQHTRLEEVKHELDVLYVTRLQKERFTDQKLYESLKGSYTVTLEALKKLRKTPIILHPLPRVDELSPEVDGIPQAKYFTQAENGVYVRAALIASLLSLKIPS